MAVSARLTRLGGLWKNHDFLKLWAGQTISELGSRITRDGLPLAAVLMLNATPLQMGILSAVGSAPVLVIGLFAGMWVDRVKRRPILIAADLGRALLLLTVPAAALIGWLRIEQLYIVMALVGILTVLFNVAYLTYLPTLVEREHIVEGNSKLAFSDSLAEILGSGASGLLIQLLTAPIAILFDALSFLASVTAVISIRKPEPEILDQQNLGFTFKEALAGLVQITRQPVLRALASSEMTLSLFGNFFGALYGLYAIRELGLGPAGLGLTIAVGGAGSLLGSLLALPLVKRFGLGPTMIGTLALNTLTALLIPLARGPVLIATIFLMVSQLLGDSLRTIYFINSISLRQSITPGHVLGRVNASMELLSAGIIPLSALLGGALGSLIGIRPTLFIACAGGILASIWLLLAGISQIQAHTGMQSQDQPET